MPLAEIGSLELCYEISGPDAGERLLLIQGLGAQMVEWYPGFVAQLETAGFRVIRFDNRDVGLSSKLGDAPDYSLHDMATDTVGLLDHLSVSSAHVVGESMGGMIGQLLAISYPERVRSLGLINTAPDLTYLTSDPEVWQVRREGPARDRDGAIAQFIERESISGLDGFDGDWVEAFAAKVIDRSYYPEGAQRQERALRAAPGRLNSLRRLAVPTAVINGRLDVLIDFRAGIDMARAIPDAELHIYPDMRHQLPPHLWPDVTRTIRRTADRANSH